MSIQDRIDWSRSRAIEALDEALRRSHRGLEGSDYRSFNYWFQPSMAARSSEVAAILRRTRDELRSCPIRYFSSVPTSSAATDTIAMRHQEHITHAVPAYTVARVGGTLLPDSDRYIALYPAWLARPAYGASRVLHEGVHIQDPARFGTAHSGFYNAYRFQAFVSDVASLPYNRAAVRLLGRR